MTTYTRAGANARSVLGKELPPVECTSGAPIERNVHHNRAPIEAPAATNQVLDTPGLGSDYNARGIGGKAGCSGVLTPARIHPGGELAGPTLCTHP